MGYLLIIVLLIFLLCSPFITIEAVNYLFGLDIPFTFRTWLAMFWLHLVVSINSYSSDK